MTNFLRNPSQYLVTKMTYEHAADNKHQQRLSSIAFTVLILSYWQRKKIMQGYVIFRNAMQSQMLCF